MVIKMRKSNNVYRVFSYSFSLIIQKCKDDYQRIGERVVKSRVRLDQTIAETSIMDGELEELAKRFRKAHSERNQFIVNWKRTLDVLEDRDEEITTMSNVCCLCLQYFQIAHDQILQIRICLNRFIIKSH